MDPYRTGVAANTPAPAPSSFKIRRRFNAVGRLVLLWGLLAALFVGLYFLLEDLRDADGPAQFAVPVVAAAVFALLIGVFLFYRRKALALARENNEGLALLGANRLDEAAALYERLAARAGNMHSLRALFLTNLGVVLLRKGETDRALGYLTTAHESGWLEKQKLFPNHAALLNALALGHQLKGDAATARDFLARAQRSVAPARRGMLLLTESVIAARAGDFAGVRTLTDANWTSAEGSLLAPQLRALRLVRAFALTQLASGGDEAEVTTLVAGARPMPAGEIDYLAAEWPAFRAFLAQHGFAGRDAQAH
jgi:tetratricopeptide (TPR) repeat protein